MGKRVHEVLDWFYKERKSIEFILSQQIFSDEEVEFYLEKILPKFEFEYEFVKKLKNKRHFETSASVKAFFEDEYFTKSNKQKDYESNLKRYERLKEVFGGKDINSITITKNPGKIYTVVSGAHLNGLDISEDTEKGDLAFFVNEKN